MTLRIRLRLAPDKERTIHVAGDRIVPESPADEELDLRRWYAIAGLGDAHLHLAANSIDEFVKAPDAVDMERIREHAAAQVRSGVLAALDKGDRDGSILGILDAPPHDRPELEMAGPLHRAPRGYYPGVGVEVEGPELAAQARPRAGADWFKVIGDWPQPGRGPQPTFDQDTLRAAVATAHAGGRRVAVHTMAPETPSMAVAAGVDSIEHGLFLTHDDLVSLGARRGFWVPTVVAMEEVLDRLGPASSGGRLIGAGLDNVRDLLPRAAATGVRVLAGSDLSRAHGRIAREAARLVDYGLTPARALAATTTNINAAIGKPDTFAVGDPADVVCIEGDPETDIAALGRVRVVIRLGRIVRLG